MKKTILLIAANCIFYFAQAQITPPDPYYSISYDNAGNRIKREYINPNGNREGKDEKEKYTQQAGNYRINVFPNPTRGQLEVAIDNLVQGDNALVLVFDTRGNLLDKKKFNAEPTTMDITNQPAGQYILRVETKQGVKEWVVAKVD